MSVAINRLCWLVRTLAVSCHTSGSVSDILIAECFYWLPVGFCFPSHGDHPYNSAPLLTKGHNSEWQIFAPALTAVQKIFSGQISSLNSRTFVMALVDTDHLPGFPIQGFDLCVWPMYHWHIVSEY